MNSDILLIRFEGEPLKTRSLPIYELASSLIAVQRIVQKAALFSEGRLGRGVHLPTFRRKELALQISRHEKGSDLWGLSPYLTDPALGPIFQGLIVLGIGALGVYVRKKVIGQQKSPVNQLLVVNIYPEVKQLVDRVGNIGGVDRIGIMHPLDKSGQELIIDADTRDYVRPLEYQLVEGKETTISGIVSRLFPRSFSLDIEDASGHYIRVDMDEQLFEKVRRLPVLLEKEIHLEGVPLYKLGDSTGDIHQFRAYRLILP
jgi:hypothetical protein